MKVNTRARKSTSSRPPARPTSTFFQKSEEARSLGAQAKLNVGRKGDRFELEADRMADSVVSSGPAADPGGLFHQVTPLAQRQSEPTAGEEEEAVQLQEEEETVQAQEAEEEVQTQEEEEEEVQTQPEETEEPVQRQTEEGEEELQTQAESGLAAARVPAAAERSLRASKGLGSPLQESVRTHMEAQFNADFSGVRIHTDSLAVQLTRLLRAKAFTHGRDIYFNQGNFAPGNRGGEHLLAHELTHTIQQGAVRPQDNLQLDPDPSQIQRQEEDTVRVRPELLQAIRLARGEIGKVNAKKANADGTRIGWQHLLDYFMTAFGGKEVIHRDVIKTIKTVSSQGKSKDAMPSWCGIFVWWAYKTAGIPIPDWKLGSNILEWVVPRKPNELPVKGDIAYRAKFQHFALVSGVESPAEAAGKSFKSIRVATINGNTSGDDNLGGQIEEKWEPISKWLAFFDPVAKLDLPPTPLVETSREPEPVKPPEPKPAPSAAETEVKPETETLEPPVEAAPAPETPAPGEADVEVELPPTPPPSQAEEVAKVEALTLEGPSDQAMVGFIGASPSQMAQTQPALGETLNQKLKQEKQQEAENAPVLVAKTSGTVEEGLTPPDQIPVPSAEVGEGVVGSDPGKLQPEPHQNKGAPPSNEDNEKLLDKQEEGGFLSWLKSNFKSFLNKIRTKDPGLNTSAGARPNVKLQGESDPGRMDRQKGEAEGQLKGQRDQVTENLKNHPGQKNIQPKEVNEEKKAQLSPEVEVQVQAPEDSAVADYANAPLPADVRNKADELLQPGLQSHLSEAKTKTQSAAEKRDTDKAAEIKNAESKTAQLNQQADTRQRDIVVQNRKKVAQQQKLGIEEAYAKVSEFNQDANKQQEDARKEIGDKVKDSEEKAKTKLDEGEKDAEKKKLEGEKEAEAKKKELEQKQKKQSWWDRAVNAVKKAVKAITKAIDTVFNKIREAVKTIIEKAKNAAIGLINAARDWVVDKLNKFRDWAKGMVNKYLKEHFPGLAKRINAGIDAAVDVAVKGVNFVADSAIAAVEAVANALAAALDKILQVFQTALKAAVQIAGAVLTGDFAEALRIAIQAACDIAGIDSKPIFDFIDRAAAQVMNILKHPGKFFNNLMKAVGGGVRNFAKNIKKHLISGLIGWLTGALSEVAITLPEKFDVKGIFSLVMQILGLTYENIKAKVIKRFPPAATVFAVIEKTVAIVTKLVTQGPAALWEEAKKALSNLKERVLGAVRAYVIKTVVKEAITWLLGLLNPAGAIVKIVKLLFDFVMFLVERFQQIKDFVLSVYNSIAAIASGAVSKAQQAVEDALARSLPVVISLLARLAGLGGIGKTVKNLIGKVSKPVHKVVDKIIDRIIKVAKKLLGKGKKKGDKEPGVSPADAARHKQFAAEVVSKLKAAGPEKTYEKLRKAKQAQAKKLAHSYTSKLKKGIRLRVEFSPEKEDRKDQDIDFKVIIAPNATVASGAVPVASDLPAEIKVGARLEYKSDGRVIKIISFDASRDRIEIEPKEGLRRRSKLGPIVEQVRSKQLFPTQKPEIPVRRYLPMSLRPGTAFIRPKLYEAHGWSAKSEAMRKRDVPKIIARVRALQASAESDTVKRQKWQQLKSQDLVEEAAAITHYDPAKVDYQTDHEPDLAIQWNASGYNKDDAVRKVQVLGEKNLRVITKEANLKKPKHEYNLFVGQEFTSQMVGVKRGAKRIQGMPFLDKSGTPIA